jgi:hypothetical protein
VSEGVEKSGVKSPSLTLRVSFEIAPRESNSMIKFDGQTLAALVCVMLAVIAMGRWTVRWWQGQSLGGCGACSGGCGAANKSEPIRLKVNLPIVDVPEFNSTAD